MEDINQVLGQAVVFNQTLQAGYWRGESIDGQLTSQLVVDAGGVLVNAQMADAEDDAGFGCFDGQGTNEVQDTELVLDVQCLLGSGFFTSMQTGDDVANQVMWIAGSGQLNQGPFSARAAGRVLADDISGALGFTALRLLLGSRHGDLFLEFES
ncbi:hypothetical protein D3C72_1372930 [compost metagenome]